MKNKIALLTPAELKILLLIERGMKNDEIAKRLGNSKNTIRSHIKSIYRRLDVSSRSQLRLHAVDFDNNIKNGGDWSWSEWLVKGSNKDLHNNFVSAKWVRISLAQSLSEVLDFPGVYVLFSGNECLYVGSSSSYITSRIKDHFYNDIRWKKCKDGMLAIRRSQYHFEELTLEARLTYKLNPKFNKRRGRTPNHILIRKKSE